MFSVVYLAAAGGLVAARYDSAIRTRREPSGYKAVGQTRSQQQGATLRFQLNEHVSLRIETLHYSKLLAPIFIGQNAKNA